VRVVHPHQHPQQRGHPGHRHRQHGEARPQHRQPDSQPRRQGGVVARERPVTACGAVGDHLDRRTQRPARSFLVDHQLERFTDRVRRHGAATGQHDPGDPSCVPAAHRHPPHPGQQHAEQHKRALGRHLQCRTPPRRRARHRPGDRPVPGHRRSTGNLHRPGPAQPARRKPGDCCRRRPQDAAGCHPSAGPARCSCLSFHGATVETEAAGNPSRTATPHPDDRQG
jgi:hypothetical protein